MIIIDDKLSLEMIRILNKNWRLLHMTMLFVGCTVVVYSIVTGFILRKVDTSY